MCDIDKNLKRFCLCGGGVSETLQKTWRTVIELAGGKGQHKNVGNYIMEKRGSLSADVQGDVFS